MYEIENICNSISDPRPWNKNIPGGEGGGARMQPLGERKESGGG